MKTSFTYLSILSFSIFMFSCGGGESSNQANDQTSDQMEKSDAQGSDEEMDITGSYTLNSQESQLMWEGNMLKVGGVSLYGHNGTVDFIKGEVSFKKGDFTGGTLVVNMESITPLDDNYGEENPKEKLVGHLSSDDFFAVEEHPMATFEVLEGDESGVKGSMTIRGNTNDETIENITIVEQGDQLIVRGSMTVDRQQYNVAFEMPAEDKVLSDDLDLEFNLVLEKR